MAHNRIYLCLAHMSGEEQKFIKEAFDTNWVVPLGPNVNGFEDDLKQFVDENKEIVALSAGTAAVHLALLACGVGPGDEVIVQSFTFCASSHPVTYLGATPVFVDSESESWNMDPVLLEQAIEDRIAKTGKKPKAIVPVALYGMPYRIDEIMVFHPLNKTELREIVTLLSANLIKRCDRQMGITLSISQTLKNHLVEKYCDVKMGARPLKRAIQTVIEDPLAEEILQGRIRQGDHILATIHKEKVVFKQRQNAKELDL